MSDTPKGPDEGESTLDNEPVSAWEAVHNPVPQPPQPQILPPSSAAAGPGGYRPVYDGGQPQGAPPVYGQQGYPQNNYGAQGAVGLLATWWMMRRVRRRLRLLLLLPLLLVVLFMVFVMHGCLTF